MKRFFAILGLAALWMVPLWLYGASSVTMDGPMTDSNASLGQAYNKNFPLNMDDHNIDYISIQTNYSSGTYAAVSFNDGRASTFSVTVASFSSLANSTATASVTISSNAGLSGKTLFIGGVNLPFNVGVVSSMTACDMASQITNQTVFLATCAVNSASGVIFATAPVYGSFYNQFSIQSSSLAAISSATFSGGQNNGVICVNGTCFTAGTDFNAVTSNNQTATNLATAFNTKASSLSVVAQAIANVVTATSTAVGTNTTYVITSSSQAAAALSPFTSSSTIAGTATGNMFGGQNSSFTINTSTIKIASHGLPAGLGVWLSSAASTSNLTYSTASVGGTSVVLGQGTTYYVIPVDANDIQLALTSTGAVAGAAVVWTSSQAKTTTDTYTLNVSSTPGTGSFAFWASNDGNLYTQIGSTNTAVFVFPSTATFTDIGNYDYKWLQARIVAPTAGAMPISVYIHGEKR